MYMKLDDDQRLLQYVFLVMEYCGTSLADYVKQNPADQRDVTWLRDVVGVVVYDVACGLKVSTKCTLSCLEIIIWFTLNVVPSRAHNTSHIGASLVHISSYFVMKCYLELCFSI